MKIKRSKTKKLFFNKWIYKVHCHIIGGWHINLPPHRFLSWANKMTVSNTQELIVFKSKLNTVKHLDIQLRIEYNYVSIFCKDKSIFENLIVIFKDWVCGVWEPGNEKEADFLTNSGKRKCVCKKYPKGLYRYKAYFNKKVMDLDRRTSFYEWFLKYDTTIMTIPNKTQGWLLDTEYYVEAPFIYVSNQKMLSMVCMRLGNGIKIIDEFILESDINTA